MAAGRSRINGVGRQQKQNKRAATSFQDKLQVIQHYEASRDMQATVLKFYPELNESERRAKARVVYRWLQLKDAIATHANSAKTKNQSRIRHVGSATTLGVDGEKQLVAWLREMRRSGEQVSTEMLRVKALAVAKERNVPEGAFAASGTWQKSFLDRNKKHLRDDADADDGGDAGDTESDASGSTEPSSVNTGDDDATRGNGGKFVINIHSGNESSKPQARVQATESATPVNQLPRTQPQQQPSEEPSPRAEQQPVPAATAKVQPVELKRHEPVVVAPAPVPAAAASVPTATAAPTPAIVAPNLPVVATPAVAPPPTITAAPAITAAAVAPAAAPAPSAATAIATAAVLPALPVATTTPAAAPALPATAIIAATALQLNSTPVKDPSVAEDAEDRELKKRKAEIEDRKAELLNESIRCDNVLKKIRIAEENMFARKRLRDAGIPQEEIDAMLPVQRD